MAIALLPSSDITPEQNHHFLNRWIDVMDEDIWHFNQCAGVGAPVQTTDDKGGVIYTQREREYIARYLEIAAGRMAGDLHYWVCPAYFTDEIMLGKGVPKRNQIMRAEFMKMISLGQRATSLIASNVSVVYTDPDNTGVQDTATITVNTTVANSEIKLFFRVVDGAPTACDYRYEIEPTVVTDSAGTATITAHRALFVKPSQWAKTYKSNDPNFKDLNIVSTSSAAGFVSAVDVYRVYTDQTSNIELYSADNTLLQSFTGDIINSQLSAFRIGDVCGSWPCGKHPTKMKVHYYAGAALSNGNIDSELYEAVVSYGASLMDAKLSKMSYWTLEIWQRYHALMVEKVGSAYVPSATKRQSNSSYGGRNGAVKAWETVLDRRLEKGGKFF